MSQLHHRNGNAAACQACGGPIIPKRGSRRQRFCNRRCREKAVQRFKKPIRPGTPDIRRSVQNSADRSINYFRENRGRGSAIRGPRHVIKAEIADAHKWLEVVSSDGICCQVAMLRPPSLQRIEAPACRRVI